MADVIDRVQTILKQWVDHSARSEVDNAPSDSSATLPTEPRILSYLCDLIDAQATELASLRRETPRSCCSPWPHGADVLSSNGQGALALAACRSLLACSESTAAQQDNLPVSLDTHPASHKHTVAGTSAGGEVPQQRASAPASSRTKRLEHGSPAAAAGDGRAHGAASSSSNASGPTTMTENAGGGVKRAERDELTAWRPDAGASDSKSELAGAKGGLLVLSSEHPTRPERESASDVAPSPKPIPSDKAACRVSTAEARKCGSCGTTETPKWRDGSTRWLCNACGLRNAKRIRALSGAPRAVRRATDEPSDRAGGEMHCHPMQVQVPPAVEPLGPRRIAGLHLDSFHGTGAEPHTSAWATQTTAPVLRNNHYSWSPAFRREPMGPPPGGDAPTCYAAAVPLCPRPLPHPRPTEHRPHHAAQFTYLDAVEPLAHALRVVPFVQCCADHTPNGCPPHPTSFLRPPAPHAASSSYSHASASTYSHGHFMQPPVWPHLMHPPLRCAAPPAGRSAGWGTAVHDSAYDEPP